MGLASPWFAIVPNRWGPLMMKSLVSALALAALCASAHALEPSSATDFSAAQKKVQSAPPKRVAAPVVRRAPSAPSVRRAPAPRVVAQPRVNKKVIQSNQGVPKSGKKVPPPPVPKVMPAMNPNLVPKTNPVVVNPNLAPKINPVVTPSKLTLGPGKVLPAKALPPNFTLAKLNNNKIAPIVKGPKMIWIGGGWKKFLPYSVLGVALIGGTYFYPDGYLSVGRPYCEGITPDGCRLNWQVVGFEGGGEEWQCVQYCPRPGAMRPPQVVALAAPPPAPQGTCELTIYSEPNFASAPVTTGEDQPQLSQSGWQDQIASIQVKSGLWEVFTEEQYAGNAMRLAPGTYPTLGPEWTKRINSFQCVQPGA